jgi:hypothetical protein
MCRVYITGSRLLKIGSKLPGRDSTGSRFHRVEITKKSGRNYQNKSGQNYIGSRLLASSLLATPASGSSCACTSVTLRWRAHSHTASVSRYMQTSVWKDLVVRPVSLEVVYCSYQSTVQHWWYSNDPAVWSCRTLLIINNWHIYSVVGMMLAVA